MRILLTGHRGRIGRPVAEYLAYRGHGVVGFDLADGADLLDLSAVKRTARGCDAIVHCGALAHDTAGTPQQIMAVNVLGTWHVLLAAEAVGAQRIVHFSSAQALGIAEGERLPDYFPVDDEHPLRAGRPYGLSKRISEELCDGFATRTGIPTVSLRPFAVYDREQYERIAQQRHAQPESEWEPHWEYGGFIDERDVVTAVECALRVTLPGHHRLLLCAADISGSAPSLELAGRLAPSVPVRQPERYVADPWRALIDCQAAHTVLGWRPRYRWSERGRRK
jgi:UDP-glucose 4-epimerase